MKSIMPILLLVAFVLPGQLFAADAAAPAKTEAVAFEVKEAAPASAPAASGAIAIPTQVAPEAALKEAELKAANEAAIKAEEERLEKQVEEVTEPPGWLKAAIAFALKMPYVGPILVQVMQWMGVLAAFLTALAGMMIALMKILSKLGKSVQFLVKINGWLAKVYPWVAWLSMFNIPSKVADKAEADSKKVA